MANPEFLSGEASASPAVEPLLAAARALDGLGFGSGALSARNGLRTTTHAAAPLGMLRAEDFVEVADYDPHLDRLLCLGRREPQPHAGMHHLMLRAKKEIQVVLMVEGREPGAGSPGLPTAKLGRAQLDNAMAALEALRKSDAVWLGRFLVVTARSPAEALARAKGLLA